METPCLGIMMCGFWVMFLGQVATQVSNFDTRIHKHGKTEMRRIDEMMKQKGDGLERGQDVANLQERVSNATTAEVEVLLQN